MNSRLLQMTEQGCNCRLPLLLIALSLMFLINCNNISEVFGDRDADSGDAEQLIFGTVLVSGTGDSGPNATNDWTDLLDGDIGNSLVTAEVDYGWGGIYHSGSNAYGNVGYDRN